MLGTKVKELAKSKRIPIYKIEEECGFAQGSISRWNEINPSFDKVVKVANLLEVPISSLVEDENVSFSNA